MPQDLHSQKSLLEACSRAAHLHYYHQLEPTKLTLLRLFLRLDRKATILIFSTMSSKHSKHHKGHHSKSREAATSMPELIFEPEGYNLTEGHQIPEQFYEKVIHRAYIEGRAPAVAGAAQAGESEKDFVICGAITGEA